MINTDPLLGYIALQLCYSTLLFIAIAGIIKVFRVRQARVLSLLYWLVILRLLLPVDINVNSIIEFWLPQQAPNLPSINIPSLIFSNELLAEQSTQSQHESLIALFAALSLALISSTLIVRNSLQRRNLLQQLKTLPARQHQRCSKLLAKAKIPFKIEREVSLFAHASSSFTIGSLKPRIAIAEELLDGLDDRELLHLLSHELAHIQRHDDLRLRLLNLLCALYFYFPVIYWCRAALKRQHEKRADELVIQQTKASRFDYAQTLVKCAEQVRSQSAIALQHANPIHSHVFYECHERLKHIQSLGARSSNRKALSAFFCVALGFVGLNAFSYQPTISTWVHSFVLPVDSGRISSHFGLREHPLSHTMQHHGGIDIPGSLNAPVAAIEQGRVLKVVAEAENGSRGNEVIIEHPQGFTSHYIHLNSIEVKQGAQIRRGQLIGRMGESGQATGVHLHLELSQNGKLIDPENYLEF